MIDQRYKFLPALAAIVLCSLPASLCAPRAEAQRQQQAETGSTVQVPEVATRFSDVVRARNAKGATVPLKVEIREWNVTRSAQAAEIPDLGFCIVHLTSGRITTEIDGKTTARNTGDFWAVQKGQHMAISLKRPQEQARLQTIAVSPGH
jgi:hypothetical protein